MNFVKLPWGVKGEAHWKAGRCTNVRLKLPLGVKGKYMPRTEGGGAEPDMSGGYVLMKFHFATERKNNKRRRHDEKCTSVNPPWQVTTYIHTPMGNSLAGLDAKQGNKTRTLQATPGQPPGNSSTIPIHETPQPNREAIYNIDNNSTETPPLGDAEYASGQDRRAAEEAVHEPDGEGKHGLMYD